MAAVEIKQKGRCNYHRKYQRVRTYGFYELIFILEKFFIILNFSLIDNEYFSMSEIRA